MNTSKKVYKVVAVIGRKRETIFKSASFNPADGLEDYNAYKSAVRAREEHCMALWGNGYSVTTDGRYQHIGKNINAGRIEIHLCAA